MISLTRMSLLFIPSLVPKPTITHNLALSNYFLKGIKDSLKPIKDSLQNISYRPQNSLTAFKKVKV